MCCTALVAIACGEYTSLATVTLSRPSCEEQADCQPDMICKRGYCYFDDEDAGGLGVDAKAGNPENDAGAHGHDASATAAAPPDAGAAIEDQGFEDALATDLGLVVEGAASCADAPCFAGVQCQDLPEGRVCGDCPAGYEGDGEHCSDVDECLDDPCAADTTCENTEGSYHCMPSDCRLWNNNRETLCPEGRYNCNCRGNCGSSTPCDQSESSCQLWDYDSNRLCAAGTYNCDCSGGCHATSPCDADGGSHSGSWPPADADEVADYFGLTNGGRPTFYFSQVMSAYPAQFQVVVVGCASVTVINNNSRFEGGGLVIKQSEVSGRGMGVIALASCQSSRCYLQY